MSKVNTNEFKDEAKNADKDSKVVSGSKNTWFKRKLARFSKASGEFWVMGKQGLIMGSLCGGLLGLILGTYESIRAKSILPLPLAVITMAGFFGGIMGVSTLIRNEADDDIKFKVMYVSKEDKDFIDIEEYRYIDKEHFFNRKI
jgi:hypothetical protein